MMQTMMPKMMQQMMGGKGGSMMAMMGRMMGSQGGCCDDSKEEHAGMNPMDMCKEMIGSIRGSQKLAILATPEVQGLFEDWVEQIENEIIEYLPEKEVANISKIAEHFKISEQSAYYFITRLAQKGKISIQAKKP